MSVIGVGFIVRMQILLRSQYLHWQHFDQEWVAGGPGLTRIVLMTFICISQLEKSYQQIYWHKKLD